MSGIELSPAVVAELRAKPGGDAIPVTTGDMATSAVDGRFRLVYRVCTSIGNLTTQDEPQARLRLGGLTLTPGRVRTLDLA